MMLEYMGYPEPALKIYGAVDQVIREGEVLSPDLGGKAKTDEVEKAILLALGVGEGEGVGDGEDEDEDERGKEEKRVWQGGDGKGPSQAPVQSSPVQ